MTSWSSDELARIEAADELELAAVGSDRTLRKPVTIWVVRHADALYVRSWRGQTGSWFRAARAQREGHISAGGVEKDVVFEDAADEVNDAIDSAYRAKYRRYGDTYVSSMVGPQARATTLTLIPRATEAAQSP